MGDDSGSSNNNDDLQRQQMENDRRAREADQARYNAELTRLNQEQQRLEGERLATQKTLESERASAATKAQRDIEKAKGQNAALSTTGLPPKPLEGGVSAAAGDGKIPFLPALAKPKFGSTLDQSNKLDESGQTGNALLGSLTSLGGRRTFTS